MLTLTVIAIAVAWVLFLGPLFLEQIDADQRDSVAALVLGPMIDVGGLCEHLARQGWSRPFIGVKRSR